MEAVMFSTPDIALWDTLRLLGAMAALVVVALTPFVMHPDMPWDQRLRFLSTPIIGVGLAGGHLLSLGEPPQSWWRIVFTTAGMTLAAVGWVGHLYVNREPREPPPTTSRHRR